MRVLVADDDNDTRDLFARFLRRCGATVVDVDSGAEALRQLITGRSFDCLVCDLGMSEMDGWTTISEVRSLDLHLPAIAVTAYASEADRTSALTAGFDVFLSKPVHLQDLAGAIATLVAPIRVRSRRARRSSSA